MSMQCPRCGSPHIQPMAVVHADGTQHFQAEHIAFTSNGQFAQGSSHGSQATLLAQHCAPPSPPSPVPFVVSLALGCAVIYHASTSCDVFQRSCRLDMSVVAMLAHNWKEALAGLGLVAVGWLLMKAWHVQAKDYSAAKDQWRKTWFCHGCGQSHQRG